MDVIRKYFPRLTGLQQDQLAALQGLYYKWNEKINVISRKDLDDLYLRHVLHSLSIAQFINFRAQSRILDLGTGGGFPGLPLAILFPESEFILIDGRAKKIKVVTAISQAIGLKNLNALHQRAESYHDSFDFVVSRAVTMMDRLCRWARPLISETNKNNIPNGIIALKGGDLNDEMQALANVKQVHIKPVWDYFPEKQFRDKYIVFVQLD